MFDVNISTPFYLIYKVPQFIIIIVTVTGGLLTRLVGTRLPVMVVQIPSYVG